MVHLDGHMLENIPFPSIQTHAKTPTPPSSVQLVGFESAPKKILATYTHARTQTRQSPLASKPILSSHGLWMWPGDHARELKQESVDWIQALTRQRPRSGAKTSGSIIFFPFSSMTCNTWANTAGCGCKNKAKVRVQDGVDRKCLKYVHGQVLEVGVFRVKDFYGVLWRIGAARK